MSLGTHAFLSSLVSVEEFSASNKQLVSRLREFISNNKVRCIDVAFLFQHFLVATCTIAHFSFGIVYLFTTLALICGALPPHQAQGVNPEVRRSGGCREGVSNLPLPTTPLLFSEGSLAPWEGS